jgi:sugar-phosphatase
MEQRKGALMIRAAIFDMDGVLIDSEPFWHEAEQEAFAKVGVTLTKEQCMETMGMPVDDVVAYRYGQVPWEGVSVTVVSDDIVRGVTSRVHERGVPMPGVQEVLQLFRDKGLFLALASSSSQSLIDTVLKKFGWESMFTVIHSAEFEENGKPHPAVFLSTAEQLGVEPVSCLVIEDSFNGLIAAKAARMKTLVVPMPVLFDQTRFDIADMKLHSLQEFNEKRWKQLEELA